ncbi:MAG: hypothetical protein AAF985_09435 [Bacteroidota bacterium]
MERTIGSRIILVLAGALLIFNTTACWLDDESEDCIVPSIEWLAIDDSIHQSTGYSFSNELWLATRQDAEHNASFPLDGEVEVIPHVKRLFERVTNKRVAVSSAFFEQYHGKRGAICTMLYQLEYHDFPDVETKLAMERQLLALLMELGSISQQSGYLSENLAAKARQLLDRAAQQELVMEQKIGQTKGEEWATYQGEYLKFNDVVEFIKIELDMLEDGRSDEEAFAKSLEKKEAQLEIYFRNVVGGS